MKEKIAIEILEVVFIHSHVTLIMFINAYSSSITSSQDMFILFKNNSWMLLKDAWRELVLLGMLRRLSL